ncbi:antibiotic biosynthesis monooxygenase [Pseudolabrys taiwanensis]|uniref:Antibiotic biosynthesis monooxygenase n=1 Tax=Pseudolabrys taiwanensis TaxID=331696 RepID=A0A345ZVS4_9HYPH|nr:antibiotic biosynthesis monooxygenase family protein [Pseudolabrys taiwanensis]AXK81021.1 antibiotic biosynthesis monooxygenase [Pseudolabrys taiwanensis]
MSAATPSVYRVDKFVVPAAARAEFMTRIATIKGLIDAQPGCRQNLVLEQVSGPGAFNVVTFVEWESADALENAKTAVTVRYKEMNFNPQDLIARLGITADMANYGLYAA